MTWRALGGATFGVGLFCLVAGLRPRVLHPARRPRPNAADPRIVRSAALFLGAGLAVFALTGWPVGGVLAGLAALSLRRLFGPAGTGVNVTRSEAVATWTEMLRDTMAGAAGLEEAVAATARVAPMEIRPNVQRLAARLEREPFGPALAEFADDLGDPTADLVVTALGLARAHHAGDLGAVLGALAASARMEAHMVLRVEAGRSRLRTAARVVTLTTLGFAALLVLLNRPFLAPYDDALGQAWLVVVGVLFAAALRALERMATIAAPPRLLAGAGSAA